MTTLLEARHRGHYAGGGRLAVVPVVGDQQPYFETRSGGVNEAGDAFAGGEFSGAVLLFDAGRTAAFPEAFLEAAQLLHEVAHVGGTRGFGDALRSGGHGSVLPFSHCRPGAAGQKTFR